jgi:hypothetical protein
MSAGRVIASCRPRSIKYAKLAGSTKIRGMQKASITIKTNDDSRYFV